MPNADYQRHSFLGGEVSPSLYERADMDKFGKWFSKAENIRFRETGAFRNRSGFVKIANTKYNSAGQIIKLLNFAFNDEETFLIEMGPYYVRFFRNGNPIMNGDEPYELTTEIGGFSEEDIKYAQAGDTLFIVHPDYGIFELARLQSDGSSWEFKRFKSDILPMKEENDDVGSKLTLSNYNQPVKYVSLANPISSIYKNVSFTFDSNVIYTATSASLQDIYSGISNALPNNYETSLDGDRLYIINTTSLAVTVPDFSLTFSATGLEDHSVTATNSAITGVTTTVSYAGLNQIDSVYVDAWLYAVHGFQGTKFVEGNTTDEAALQASGYGAFYWSDGTYAGGSSGIQVDTTNDTLSYYCGLAAGLLACTATITVNGKRQVTKQYTYESDDDLISGKIYLLESSDSNFFDSLSVRDCVLVKHASETQQLTGSYSATGSYTLGPIRSDGNWRFYTLGNWVGNITIQYSTDNKETWIDYYKWASQDANDTPANINTSGSLVADDLVWFRVAVSVTSTGTKPLQVFFAANSFTVNSYYKILVKNSGAEAVVECVKNDVGTFSNNHQWRLPAFSNTEGWPQTIAFYQNRLFFGKDYIIYGSRSNDFWDFYEPVKLQADDPVTMSLLSNKVNTIRNLLTQRSFFTFTAGGEFGVGSEGALTQNDKYLKPFSANGSAPCLPITISDVVLFVDKSYNSIRALKYSLETDGYEAPDITLTLRKLLQDERIISTEIIYEEKEALFLSATGTIWVLKYITDQNVMSWSHWKHAFGKITNICVVPRGQKHDLYIGVEHGTSKWIEKLTESEFMDTVEYFDATEETKVSVTGGKPGDVKIVLQGDKRYFKTVDAEGKIECPDDSTAGFRVGSVYTSTATLLSPVIQTSDYSHNNYEVKAPFKVFFYYLNSHVFKVGVEEDEKMEIEWQPVPSDIDDEKDLTSGKKSVLIPSRFDGSARVSFVQEEPYPMEVADVLIQIDYGGK